MSSVFALFVAVDLASPALSAQVANRINAKVDSAQVSVLPNHHPQWAVAQNSVGPVSSELALTIVLSRTPEQEAALQKLLADQQDPGSPDYHHWLTPTEFGARFGLSDSDITEVSGWLQSQGLQVSWVAPSRTFIRFGGKASDVGRAFQTEINRYNVDGKERVSVSSDPMIPEALTQAIKSIRGLYTIDEQPLSQAIAMAMESPEMTLSDGSHFISPGDFSVIYHRNSTAQTGAGQTIGIVGRARVNPADLDNFKALTGPNFQNPTEIVPTAFGGVDPGPALTAPSTGNVSLGDQSEATLDVQRAGSVAFGAQLLLVVATSASGGIEADAQYLVQTTPVPAQVMSISFGLCESAAGPAGIAFWDALFQQAAAEGISAFVSSGDSGAAGCDAAFVAPPATPKANSSNYLCSSSYATCVGGTEFNDTANPLMYWTEPGPGAGTTAVGYIPEGGWNESWNGTTSIVAGSGGGVSTVIATPPWQTGTGVPAARSGRYTPDVSFSSSMHDGYFGCLAAAGSSCVVGADTTYRFEYFWGTSAAAPSMAGVAALLDQNIGAAQGNLNPGLYQMAVGAPVTFHDVTVATSGVTTCDLNTPSLCNNSIGGPTGLTGAQPGFAVGTGYDEVTGLGSLDIGFFVNAYQTASKIYKPTVTFNSLSWPVNQDIPVVVRVSNSPYSPDPTGNVVVTAGSYTSAATPLTSSNVLLTIPAGSLAMGTYTLTASYTPDAGSAQIYLPASGGGTLTVAAPEYISPNLGLTPTSWFITNTQAITLTVTAAGGYGHPVPTGTVIATSGGYSSGLAVLVNSGGSNPVGVATFNIPAGTLPVGDDTITVTYTPDTAGASLYKVTAISGVINNAGATITPQVSAGTTTPDITTAGTAQMAVIVTQPAGDPVPTGSVVLTSGSFTSGQVSLANGAASISVPGASLQIGSNTFTVSYTPDTQGAKMYSGASGTSYITVSMSQKITPIVTLTQQTGNPTSVQPLSLTVTLSGGAGNPAPSGFVNVSAGSYPVQVTLSGGTGTATLPAVYFTGGSNLITVDYLPDSPASFYYNRASGSTTVTVAKVTPTLTVTPSRSNLSSTDSVSVTVAISGGSGAPDAGGTVTLSSQSYTSAPASIPASVATINVVPESLLPGTDTLTATYTGDSRYNTATGTNTVTVTVPVGASFAVQGTSPTLTKGTAVGNYSTVTVTPANGFVGTVALSAAITSGPAGAQYPPTLNFGSPSSVTVLGTGAFTAKLTINTTAATSSALAYPPRPGARWYATGGAALACILLFCIPARRRRWQTIVGSLMLLVALAGGVMACGGGGGGSSSGGGGGNPGTTSGNYTITITGTAGSTTASNTITLTVQ